MSSSALGEGSWMPCEVLRVFAMSGLPAALLPPGMLERTRDVRHYRPGPAVVVPGSDGRFGIHLLLVDFSPSRFPPLPPGQQRGTGQLGLAASAGENDRAAVFIVQLRTRLRFSAVFFFFRKSR